MGRTSSGVIVHNPKFPFYTEKQFKQALENKQVLDAISGGLVIGRSHDEGNIYMVKYMHGMYVTWSNMEGGEYLINHEAYTANKIELTLINNWMDCSCLFFTELPINCTNSIVTRNSPEDVYLWIDEKGMFVINKYATYKYFDRLQEINASTIM